MKFHYTTLDDCHICTGVVLIVDVLRAFSNAAYAFARGAKQIILVSTVEEALALKEAIPNSKAMGEVGGVPPIGFDFGNSPSQILEENLNGLTLIQRTGAGTQGAVRCTNADFMLATSFVVAAATAKHILKMSPPEVTFVITGGLENDEDVSCAEYLQALINGEKPEPKPFIKRVYESRDAVQHLDPTQPEFPEADLDYCTQIDRFDFSMPILRENGLLVMHTTKS